MLDYSLFFLDFVLTISHISNLLAHRSLLTCKKIFTHFPLELQKEAAFNLKTPLVANNTKLFFSSSKATYLFPLINQFLEN